MIILTVGICLLMSDLFAQSDGLPRGAYLMPYKRYEAEDAQLIGNAALYVSSEFRQEEIASEASNQKYVGLANNDDALSWTLQHPGRGMTIRFTMPDGVNGEGENGSLDLYVDDQYVKTINITSYWAWQYFPTSDPDNTPASRPRMKFDEIHFLLASSLQVGQTVKLVKTNGDSFEYGIDFMEIEEVGPPISKPSGYISVTDHGAVANDGIDDHAAFVSAMGQAASTNSGIYIPAGTFDLSKKWHLWPSSISVTGAGMWYTEIFFTTEAISGGGIYATGATVDVGHFYVNTVNDQRFINGNYVNYKGFSGHYGANSSIHDVWVTHFETGAWIADYTSPIDHTEYLTFTRNRIRNNYADGINLSQGTSNSTVSHCDFRSNGDDAMAVWTSAGSGAQMGVNNTFYNNTVEMNYRAGGVAIFGGDGHTVHHCLIKDGLGSSGLRLTTDFAGYHFESTNEIRFYEISVINCGTSYDLFGNHRASIDVKAPTDPVSNITFENIDITNSQRHAVQLGGNEVNITLRNINVDGTGLDPYSDSNFTVGKDGTALFSSADAGTANLINFSYQNIELDTAFFVVNPAYNLLFDQGTVTSPGNRSFLIDFGPNDVTNGNHTINPDQNDHYWNNVDNTTSGTVFSLITMDNESTDLRLTVNAGAVTNGIQNGGLLNPEPNLLDSVAINTATQDYFYTTTSTAFKLSNLDQSQLYTIGLFGSRNTSETRITEYHATGRQQQSVLLQTSGTNLGGVGYDGNNSALAYLGPMKPDSNGEILIEMSVNTGSFAYVNLMTIKEVTAPQYFFVDFGPNDVTNGNSTSSPDGNNNTWNNAFDGSSNITYNLVDHYNSTTSLTIRNATSFLKNGIQNGGLLNPDPLLLDDLAVATATQDYFYVTSSGSLEVSGLDISKAYRFTLFGSRDVSQTRITTYTISGNNVGTGTLQTSGTDLGGAGMHGNNSTTYRSTDIFPTEDGKINLAIEVANGGFAYINALRIETVHQPLLIWSGSSWNQSSGPSAFVDAAIDGDYVTASSGAIEVKNLTVNNNKTLTVSAGTTLHVRGSIVNNGQIVIESGGTLITYGNESVEGNDILIKRNTRFADGRYSFVGSPIHQSSQTLIGADLGSPVYEYHEAENYEADGLMRWQDASAKAVIPGRGYAQAGKGELVFAGVPNAGTILHQCTYTDRGDANDGWNLIANPYPASIKLEYFFSENPNLTGAVYLWDDYASNIQRGSNSDYIVANAIGVVANSRSNQSNRFNGHIGAMQGFFVKLVDGTDTDVTFTEEMRVSGFNGDVSFFRMANQEPIIRLSLSNAQTRYYQETVVGIRDDATLQADLGYDADYLGVNDQLQFFTMIGEKAYAIQGLPNKPGAKVDLGFNLDDAINLTLRVEEQLGSFFLIDKITREVYDMSKISEFEFFAESGEKQKRFQLVYNPSDILVTTATEKRPIYKHVSGNLVVTVPEADIHAFMIMDLSGRILNKGDNNGERVLNIPMPESGVKVIMIQTNEGFFSQKILFE